MSNEPSDEAIKRTLDFLHEKAKGSTAITVTEPEVVSMDKGSNFGDGILAPPASVGAKVDKGQGL